MQASDTQLFAHGLYGVIFDCDGVMIDSREANAIFYNRVLAALNLPPMTPEQEQYCFMATSMQCLQHIVPPKLHEEIARVTKDEVNYERDIVPLLRLQKGFREFIDELHFLGVRMAVHTNRRLGGMQTVLDIFSLPPYFMPVVTADSAAPKPSPEGTQHICSLWQCRPRDVLFVGDSEHDRQAAAGAGVVFAAFNAGTLPGKIAAGDFAALRAALNGVPPFTASS